MVSGRVGTQNQTCLTLDTPMIPGQHDNDVTGDSVAAVVRQAEGMWRRK